MKILNFHQLPVEYQNIVSRIYKTDFDTRRYRVDLESPINFIESIETCLMTLEYEFSELSLDEKNMVADKLISMYNISSDGANLSDEGWDSLVYSHTYRIWRKSKGFPVMEIMHIECIKK